MVRGGTKVRYDDDDDEGGVKKKKKRFKVIFKWFIEKWLSVNQVLKGSVLSESQSEF